VDLVAGGDVAITGSDVLSKQGIGISGQNVTIQAAQDTTQVTETQQAKSSGLHVSLKGGAVDTAMAVKNSVERAGEVKDDRLSALYAAKAGQALFSGNGAGVQNLASAGDQLDALANTTQDTPASGNAGLSLRIGIGASKSSSEQAYTATTAVGSRIASEGDVSIVARGDGQGNGGDLTATGSRIEGDNVTLAASRDLMLQSAQESSEQLAKDKASSGEIGITIGSEAGIGVYVSASMAKGKGEGTGTTHAETTLDAANTLTLISGRDTTLEGAQARGETVIANVGRDLTLISQQDTNDYNRKDKAGGIDVAVGTGGGSVSGYYNQSKIDSRYTSVREQTGIQAGAGGFDITVGNHTELTGAAIASTADPALNRLSTGSLSATDLKNEAKYKAKSFGISGGGGSSGGGFGGGLSPSVPISQSDSASTTTQAGISVGTVEVRNGDNTALASIDRSVTALQQDGLKEIFDERKVNETLELGQVAGEVGMRAAGDLAQQMGWEEGSKEKVILHGAVGAAIAALGGGNALEGLAGAAANQLAVPAIKKALEAQGIHEGSSEFDTYMQLASIAVGATVGGSSGAATALAGEQFNRQLHPNEIDFLKNEEVIEDYIAYMAEHGVTLTEEQARVNLDRYGAAKEDAQWASLNGRDGLTEDFLKEASKGLSYTDSRGSQHAFFYSTDREYNDETVNLKTLFQGLSQDSSTVEFLNNNQAAVSQGDWLARFRAGQSAGAAKADNESSIFSDIRKIVSGITDFPGYAYQSAADSQMGPLDDKQMADYYQKLLLLQNRAEEAGYAYEYDWATTQRMVWSGALAGEIGGLLAKAGVKAVSAVAADIADAAKVAGKVDFPVANAVADGEVGGYSYYDKLKTADGKWDWPKNLGFAGDPVENVLSVGTRLDRYGTADGSFLSPVDTPFEQRALAPGSKAGGYHQYEVIKPLPVIEGKIAPAFEQPGGGTQMLPNLSDRVNVEWLVREGYIREIR
jgi:filamentous hemagglutinin